MRMEKEMRASCIDDVSCAPRQANSFLARGTRSRYIELMPDGGVHFRQVEELRGPLAGYVEKVYRSRIEAGQNAENAALKIEAERRAAARGLR
jgi:hypothetical protein